MIEPLFNSFSRRRTGNGFGLGSINGGTNYQQVTGSVRQFFTGRYWRIWIYIQYELSGFSLDLLTATTYMTQVTTTLTAP